jgi:hypothetical protein
MVLYCQDCTVPRAISTTRPKEANGGVEGIERGVSGVKLLISPNYNQLTGDIIKAAEYLRI